MKSTTNGIPRLFGTNGIRGVVGKTITADFAYRVGAALGVLYPDQHILLGRDGRESGNLLSDAVTAGLVGQGNIIEHCGLITTPALEFLVKHSNASAGIMITASHNPSEYNGFKIVDSDGVEVSREREVIIERLIHRNRWKVKMRAGDESQKSDQLTEYIARIKTFVKDTAARSPLKIIVDVGNGVASLTTPVLLRELGCDVVTLNDNLDGKFPGRPSEPRPENLFGLSKMVESEHADFGVAHDGDGDRAIFVDETGTIHLGDRSLALVADEVLRDNPGGKIVTPLNSSMALKEIAKKRHGHLIFTKVGSIFVSRTMLNEKAILGGEENGGIFYAPHHPVRDGTMATALILNALVRNKLTLSKLIGRLPRFFMAKEKIDCPDDAKIASMNDLKRRLGGKITSSLDGLKIDFRNAWLLIRPSGTEPLIRIYAEAATQDALARIISEYQPLVVDSVKRTAK